MGTSRSLTNTMSQPAASFSPPVTYGRFPPEHKICQSRVQYGLIILKFDSVRGTTYVSTTIQPLEVILFREIMPSHGSKQAAEHNCPVRCAMCVVVTDSLGTCKREMPNLQRGKKPLQRSFADRITA